MIVRATLFDRFFDRTAELGALLAAFRDAARFQRAASIVVSGEAGIGKSRLLAEFRKQIAHERGHVLVGACLEYARTPYGPFLDALGNERAASKAVEAMRDATEGAASAEDDEKLRRFTIVEQALRRTIATRGVTVLIVEDIHWSDAASLELFHYLGRRLADVPALLIATARSDEVEADPALAKAVARLIRDGVAELRVEGIPHGIVATAIRNALPEGVRLPGTAVQRICELAEGRPLIAEELLRGTLEHAHAGEVDPRAAVSMRASIVERLQAFSAPAQLTLTYAAVIGRDFDSALLARIANVPEAEVLRTIRAARNAQLVKQTAGDRFSFRHALTREVLYRELLTAEARALHATIASVLEDAADVRADEVAYHWWAARDPIRGLAWNERVGDRAAAMSAYADAAVRYERALSFAERGSELRASLLEKATSALVTIGHMERARTLCLEAADERKARGDDDTALRLMLWVARQWYEAGSAAEALATVRTVREQLAKRRPAMIDYTAETTYAAMLALQGQPAEALELLDLAGDVRCAHDPIDDFRAMNTRGTAFAALGDHAAAVDAYAAAGDLAERLGNVDLLLHARNNMANTLALTGAMDRALDIYTDGAALAGRHGQRRMKTVFCVNVAYCRLMCGDLAGSRAALRDELDERSAATAVKVWAQALRIRLRTLLGDDESEPFVATMDAALQLGEPQVVALASGAISKDRLAAGDERFARTTIDEALFALSAFDYTHWLLDAVGEAGDELAVAYARGLLDAAQRYNNPLANACRSLFDARIALRGGADGDGRELALRAHAEFLALGLRVDAAEALEGAGDLAGALSLYRDVGATVAIRRLEARAGRRRAGAATEAVPLTRREREIAELLARGYSSRVVAAELGIGARTVETHVAAIYHKLGIKSRAELAHRIGTGSGTGT
jgi:DNA-binding CsgD family transcriptional regulator/tetratricopeptide (TPR) repeat protein